MACLLKLAPQFIHEKRLCWLRTPLYVVENGKKRSYYFNDEEFLEAKAKGKVIGEVHREKGIGATSPEEARESMFTPEYQRLEALVPDEKSFEILRQLMGPDVEPRTDFLFSKVDFSTVHE